MTQIESMSWPEILKFLGVVVVNLQHEAQAIPLGQQVVTACLLPGPTKHFDHALRQLHIVYCWFSRTGLTHFMTCGEC